MRKSRKGKGELFRLTKLLEQALRQVGALPDYIKQMRGMRLTDAQVAEDRRRRADPNRKLLSQDEARERVMRLGS
jgi:hypothetical protein